LKVRGKDPRRARRKAVRKKVPDVPSCQCSTTCPCTCNCFSCCIRRDWPAAVLVAEGYAKNVDMQVERPVDRWSGALEGCVDSTLRLELTCLKANEAQFRMDLLHSARVRVYIVAENP